MGRGNVCTFGQAEGLYFVDNEFLDVYSKKNEDGELEYATLREADNGFEYDEAESYFNYEDFKKRFAEAMKERFRSFDYIGKWISNDRFALLENKLFYVVLEDNQWSIAVELIQKEGEYGGEELVGLQMGLYLKYLEGMKNILLDMHGEVGTYSGAWTSGRIVKEAV
ncbi:MAG: hypothetical protein II897_04115 [Clostridia bacterium]|nr:hypothetical protein [Clostridia bacterium]